MAAWAKSRGKSLYSQLIDIYLEYGLYKENLINIVRKGKEGADEIKAMMTGYRSNPPATINNSRVVKMDDYSTLISTNCITGEKKKIDLIKSDVLQYFLEDGSKISIRPSGTEPKIKFYFSVNTKLPHQTNLKKPKRFSIKELLKSSRLETILIFYHGVTRSLHGVAQSF